MQQVHDHDTNLPPEASERSALLLWGFWVNILVVLIAAPLTILYLLILMHAADEGLVTLNALLPLLVASVAFAHMAVLLREYMPDRPQSALWFHAGVAIAGIVTLVCFIVVSLQTPTPGLIVPCIFVGALISAATWAQLGLRIRPRRT